MGKRTSQIVTGDSGKNGSGIQVAHANKKSRLLPNCKFGSSLLFFASEYDSDGLLVGTKDCVTLHG